MDNIKDDEEEVDQTKPKLNIGRKFLEEFSSLAKLGSQLDVWLLLPLSFYSGFEQTYFWFEFSRVTQSLNNY